MKRGRRHPAGFALVELMWVILLGTVLLCALGALMSDAFYLMRVAGRHSDRMAIMDSLARQIRADALESVAYEWDGRKLTLKLAGADPAAPVCYTIEAESVTRTVGAADTHAWHTYRLAFDAWCRSGPHADLFELEFIEQPPERAGYLPDRTFALGVLLPASHGTASAAAGSEEGGSP
jgi:hypothetical protein